MATEAELDARAVAKAVCWKCGLNVFGIYIYRTGRIQACCADCGEAWSPQTGGRREDAKGDAAMESPRNVPPDMGAPPEGEARMKGAGEAPPEPDWVSWAPGERERHGK